jgi:hypothetical protein
MNSIFMNCENAEFSNWMEEGVLGHSNSSSRFQKLCGRSFEMVSWPSLFCDSSGHMSNLPVFGPLIDC